MDIEEAIGSADANANAQEKTSVVYESTDDAADAFLNASKKAAEKPADKKADEGDEKVKSADKGQAEEDNDPDDQNDNVDDEGDEDEADKKEDDGEEPIITDEKAVVQIKIGDETKTVKVNDLKRLYGQEQALTKKSMEASAKIKRSETAYAVTDRIFTELVNAAKRDFEPYAKLDRVQLAQSLSPADFAKVDRAAKAAAGKLQWYQESSERFAKEHAEEMRAQQEAAAATAAEYIRSKVPDWDKAKWTSLRDFALDSGFEAEEFDNLVHGPGLFLLYQAQQFATAQKKAKDVPLSKKVAKAPKDGAKPQRGDRKTDTAKETLQRLRSTGEMDDAVAAFQSRTVEARNRAKSRASD